MLLALVVAGTQLIPKRVPAGCPDCFEQPPLQNEDGSSGWQLGFPDVTNPTFDATRVYEWRWKDKSRDDFCPHCFDFPVVPGPVYSDSV
mmetsp:Transcript_10947/g.26830  ORF Transcript_10947/g.26830 Transcript_10947/m.26830 type:complete len:89 (-) Transcript_10947:301-567(-)